MSNIERSFLPIEPDTSLEEDAAAMESFYNANREFLTRMGEAYAELYPDQATTAERIKE